MDTHLDSIPSTVTMNDMLDRIDETKYTLMEGTTNTMCQVRMLNGYTVWGKSSFVDPAKYNQALGEKYAFEDAINQLWPLEGYLLAERRFQADLK